MNRTIFWEYMRTGIITIIIGVAISVILTYVGQRTVVSGDSMYPGLKNGESVLVNKLAYKFDDVERFDVVIFPHTNAITGEEAYYIKRIIGLPGETIRIHNGLIYINGEILTEYYGCYDDDLPYFNGIAEDEMYIGEDEYFVMGDNRNNSDDSRTFGCIKKEDLTGEALITIYPFEEIGLVK